MLSLLLLLDHPKLAVGNGIGRKYLNHSHHCPSTLTVTNNTIMTIQYYFGARALILLMPYFEYSLTSAITSRWFLSFRRVLIETLSPYPTHSGISTTNTGTEAAIPSLSVPTVSFNFAQDFDLRPTSRGSVAPASPKSLNLHPQIQPQQTRPAFRKSDDIYLGMQVPKGRMSHVYGRKGAHTDDLEDMDDIEEGEEWNNVLNH